MAAKKEHSGLERLSTGLDVNGGAAFIAGLIGGVVFLIIELVTGFIYTFDTPLGPADVVLRTLTTDGAVEMDFGLIFIASIFHLFVSVLLGFVLAFIVYRWSKGIAVGVGLVYGFVIYMGVFFLFAIAFPEMIRGRGLIMLLNHLLFGGLTAWLYKTFETNEANRAEASSSGSSSSGSSSSGSASSSGSTSSSTSSESSSSSSSSDDKSSGSSSGTITGAPSIHT